MRSQFLTAIWEITTSDWNQARAWVEQTQNRDGSKFTGNAETILDQNGDHLIDGALGEILWQKNVCPTATKLTPGPLGTEIGADFLIDQVRIDVKTKRRKGPMKPYYVAEVDCTQRGHHADWYAFLSLDTENWIMEYIACIPKRVFWNQGWLMPEGTWMEAPNGEPHQVLKSCYHLDAQTIYHHAITLPNHFIPQPKILKNQNMNQEPQPRTFVLFPNEYAKTDKSPQWKGKITHEDGTEEQMVAWEKTSKSGTKYLSGKFTPFQPQTANSQNEPNSPQGTYQPQTEKSPF